MFSLRGGNKESISLHSNIKGYRYHKIMFFVACMHARLYMTSGLFNIDADRCSHLVCSWSYLGRGACIIGESNSTPTMAML